MRGGVGKGRVREGRKVCQKAIGAGESWGRSVAPCLFCML